MNFVKMQLLDTSEVPLMEDINALFSQRRSLYI
uniref:Uncharacterized protein n=1 Tax=Rhizophora mucronata TaxID=61149 RepID=A0A2P2NYJ6_RHIMU